MKTYPKYKDSGIPWIGQIPEEWDKCRFKMLHSGTNVGEAIDKTYWTDDENDTVFYTAGVKPIHTNYPDFPIEKITKEEDILLARNGTPYVFLPSVHAAYTDHIIRASILPSVNKVYVSYALAVAILHEAVDSVSLPTWSASLWNAQVLPVPPLSEQQAIAEYLDKKTGNIDELVGLLNKQIADVRAYRQSLITETVTQGLNKDVPMKDSGVEWIGQIPDGWKVLRLKHILEGNLQYGANESAESDNPNWPRYIRITDIDENGKLRPSTYKTLSPEKALPYMLKFGDILFARSGATVGKSFIFKEGYPACFAGYLIKASCGQQMQPEYLYYYTLSHSYNQWKNSVFSQATIQNIGADKYSEMPIPVPPLSEQQAIVEFLDKKTKDIDELLVKLEAQVADLLAYKSSLISEAVTGKIYIEPQDDNTTVTALS